MVNKYFFFFYFFKFTDFVFAKQGVISVPIKIYLEDSVNDVILKGLTKDSELNKENDFTRNLNIDLEEEEDKTPIDFLLRIFTLPSPAKLLTNLDLNDDEIKLELVKKYISTMMSAINFLLRNIFIEINYKIEKLPKKGKYTTPCCDCSGVVPYFLKNIETKIWKDTRKSSMDENVSMDDLDIGNRLYIFGCPKKSLSYKFSSLVINSNKCGTMGGLSVKISNFNSAETFKDLTITLWGMIFKVIAGIDDPVLSLNKMLSGEGLVKNGKKIVRKYTRCSGNLLI